MDETLRHITQLMKDVQVWLEPSRGSRRLMLKRRLSNDDLEYSKTNLEFALQCLEIANDYRRRSDEYLDKAYRDMAQCLVREAQSVILGAVKP